MKKQNLVYSSLETRNLLSVTISGTDADDTLSISFESETDVLISLNDGVVEEFDIASGLFVDLGLGNDRVIFNDDSVGNENFAQVNIANTENIESGNGRNQWRLRDTVFENTARWSGTLNDHISFQDVDRLFGGDSADRFVVQASVEGVEIHGGAGNDQVVFGRKFATGTVNVFGGAGDDGVRVRGDRIDDVNSAAIFFNGGQGTDRLVLNDRNAATRNFGGEYRDYEAVDYSIRTRFLSEYGFQTEPVYELQYDNTIERVRINGAQDYENRFLIQPNEFATKFRFNSSTQFQNQNLLAVRNNGQTSGLVLDHQSSGAWQFSNGSRVKFQHVTDTFDFQRIIGLTNEQARDLATDLRVRYRVGVIDGVVQGVTLDYLPTRITASLSDGVVIAAWRDDGRVVV